MQRELNDRADVQGTKWRSPRLVLSLFFGLGFLSTALAGMKLVSASGSLSGRFRLVVGATFALDLVFLILAVLAGTSQPRADRLWRGLFGSPRVSRVVLLLSGLLSFFSLAACLTPSARLGNFANSHAQLLPLFAALAVTGLAGFLISLVEVYGFQRNALASLLHAQKRGLLIALAVFALSLLVWLVFALLDMGVHAKEDFWFGAGSPILFQQVLVGLFFTVILFLFEGRIVAWLDKATHKKISPDLVIFLLVWAVTALLWARQPAPSGFTAPRPLPPNEELYPFADALRYDLGSQFALIGQGFNNGRFYYRVFYEGFLFLLHLVAGQNYEKAMSLQAMLFAVLPALVYLLGKALKNRSLGILSASAVLFAGLNSIPASELVDLANPKQMLTDFPTALGVAGFTLLTVLWLKKPERISLLFWAAGVLGATALIRTSALGLLPLLIVLVWFFLPRSWKEKSILTIFIVVIFLASAIPWSTVQRRFVTDMYSSKIMSVIGLRYDVLPWPENTFVEKQPRPHISPVVAITDHFAHNLVTSVLILPASPIFNDVREVVKGKFPYWNPQWGGSLDLASGIFIFLNLAVLVLGIGSALQFSGWAGMIPLVVYFGYIAINSIGRTSGGRYSAPMDWIILFYYAWGIMVVLSWAKTAFLSTREAQAELPARADAGPAVTLKNTFLGAYPAFLVFFGISALMVLLSVIVPKRYAIQPTDQLSADFISKGYGKKIGLDASTLQAFLAEDQAGIWTGRALFPRYYLSGQGIDAKHSAFQIQDYPRLVFSLVGPQDHLFVVLPGALPKHFPNSVGTIVLGCKADDYTIDALAVIVISDKTFIYSVPPSVALHCPLELKSGGLGAPP
jgi:hypothetical protein